MAADHVLSLQPEVGQTTSCGVWFEPISRRTKAENMREIQFKYVKKIIIYHFLLRYCLYNIIIQALVNIPAISESTLHPDKSATNISLDFRRYCPMSY